MISRLNTGALARFLYWRINSKIPDVTLEGVHKSRMKLDEDFSDDDVSQKESRKAADSGQSEAGTESPQAVTPIVGLHELSDDNPRESDGPRPRRFLAGHSSADPFRARLPRWFRAYLLGACFLVSLCALISVLTWPFVGELKQPVVSSLGIFDYVAPSISEIPYGQQDALRVAQSFEGSQEAGSQNQTDVTIARDANDFDRFLREKLQTPYRETCVLYVIAHGVSHHDRAYLLASESDPFRTSTWYPVDELLNRLGETTARNVLLILDGNSVSHDLSLGMIGNDFAYHLARQFDEQVNSWKKQPTQTDKNIWILISCGDGEVSWTSPTFRGSAFALATKYCLRGGGRADQSQYAGISRDGNISVQETFDFVRNAVANWSYENRFARQTPVACRYGDDFLLADVNEAVSMASLISDRADLTSRASDMESETQSNQNDRTSETAEKTSGDTAVTKQATGSEPDESPASKNAREPTSAETQSKDKQGDKSGQVVERETNPSNQQGDKASSIDTRAQSTKFGENEVRLGEIWRQRESLSKTSAVLKQPLVWSRYQHTLMRVEEALLAGSMDQASRLLDRDIPLLLGQLQRKHSEESAIKSSIVGLDQLSSQTPPGDLELIQKVLNLPIDSDVAALRNAETVESQFLWLLGQVCRTGEKWADAESVQLAIRCRSLAEQIVNSDQPLLVRLLKRDIEVADATRTDAQVDLILGRIDSANKGLQSALEAYRTILDTKEIAVAEFIDVQQMVIALPTMIDWLGHDPEWNERKISDLERLNAFIDELKSFCVDPSLQALHLLHKRSEGIRQRAENYAVNSLEPVDWRRSVAVLKLPFLQSKLRQRLLMSLLLLDDTVELNGHRTPISRTASERVWSPFALTHFFKFIRVVHPQPVVSDKFVSRLQVLDPSLRAATGTDKVTQSLTDVRQARAEARREFRAFISTIRSHPHDLRDTSNAMSSWLSLLATSFWTADSTSRLDSQNSVAVKFNKRMAHELLAWRARRLQQENDLLPKDCYDPILESFKSALRHYDSEFVVASSAKYFQLETEAAVGSVGGQPVIVPFTLRVMRGLPVDVGATLILSLNSENLVQEFELNGVPAVNGVVEAPLTDVVALSEHRFRLALRSQIAEENSKREVITAFVKLSNNSIDWLPFPIRLKPPPQKPAELVIEWDDRGLKKGRIDLYPNQSIPISLSVQKNDPQISDLRIEFVGVGQVQPIQLTKEELKSNIAKVTPKPGFNASFADDNLTIQLFSGETLLDEQSLRAAILDLTQCFRCDVVFDMTHERIKAHIIRVHKSDIQAPVPFELVNNAPDADSFVRGNIATTLEPSDSEAFLDIQGPVDSTGSYRIAISSSGVPRLFRYIVGRNQLVGTPDTSVTLMAESPKPNAKFIFRAGTIHLPVRFNVDSPRTVSLIVGIDLNRNGQLDDLEIAYKGDYWSGRDSQLNLVSTEKPAGLRVQSKVSDIMIPVDVTGLTGSQTIIAKSSDGTDSSSLEIPIFILKESPKVRVTWPIVGSSLAANAPLQVTLQGEPESYAAIDHIEIGFDMNKNGKLDKEELVSPIEFLPGQPVHFTKSSRLSISIPTAKLKPQPVTMLVRTKTMVLDSAVKEGKRELASRLVTHRVVLTRTGRVTGQVVTPDGLPKKRAIVSIPGLLAKETDAEGKFLFDSVPPGLHRITAETTQRRGQRIVSVQAAKVSQIRIKLFVK